MRPQTETRTIVEPRATTWVLVPAVVMALAWGLRGYIGGGCYGAMIPGALVPLVLCQYLGVSPATAALAVAFGAFGIGFGGSMTYGQTLGLLRQDDTLLWGLTGTTLKGGIWGLLGGAVLGLGFIARHVPKRHVAAALIFMMAGFFVGIHFVNVPKLVYFSDPVNRPREESWAGLLVGAAALLGVIGKWAPSLAWAPCRVAAYGAFGGAVGFGGGSLFLALGARVEPAWRWLPYWKFMEFSFGFLLGAALGYSAWQLRQRLRAIEAPREAGAHPVSSDHEPSMGFEGKISAALGIVVVVAAFYAWPWLGRSITRLLSDFETNDIRRTLARVCLGYYGVGVVMLLSALRSTAVAWQGAISLTIVAAAIDWQADLLPRGGIDLPEAYRQGFLIAVGAIAILFVAYWQSRMPSRYMTLFLFTTGILMALGWMMGLGHADLWQPRPDAEALAGGRTAYLWQRYRGEVVVHATFLGLFGVSMASGVSSLRRGRLTTKTP